MSLFKKHWVHFLPEVGNRYQREGDRIQSKLAEIERMKHEIKMAEYAVYGMESQLKTDVSMDWTDIEIEEAKQQSQKQ